ncbi:MAG: hypothetical protein WA609_07210 [Terriglobales bacterium]
MSAVVGEFRKQVTTEFRKPVLTLVEASWQGSDGSLQTVPARMEDKSAGGACIRVKAPIVVGAKLKIKSRHENFSGTARYCRTESGEFLVGIQRDSANSPLPDRAKPKDVPVRKSMSNDAPISSAEASTVKATAAPVPTVEIKSPPPEPQQSKPSEVPAVGQQAESDATLHPEKTITGHASAHSHEIEKEYSPDSRPPDLASLMLRELPPNPRAEPGTELQTKQLPKEAGEGRKRMRDKWLELPWHRKQEGVSGSGPGDGEAGSNGNNAKENSMHDLTQPIQKVSVRAAREAPTFQIDLSPMEDIYRAAGIMDPRKGYSITKVVDMLHSAHIRDLSKEMKRAAVLMALETAGIPIDQVQRDAKGRQDALDAHEALQRKHVEAEWARKAEEVIQIQAELESIKAHYMARISQNMEGVAREKETFASWLTLKQRECQSMADAVELCLKSLASETAGAPPSDLTTVKVSAKMV